MLVIWMIALFLLVRVARIFLRHKERMADEKQSEVCNAMIDCHARTFNSTQSSQLFINCCFAIAFAGMFLVCTEALRTAKESGRYLAPMWFWILLSGYVMFAVWRQYSNYLIPLQFYRNKPELDKEEAITLAITFALALFPVAIFYLPRLSLAPLLIIILLNIVKIFQMKSAVDAASSCSPKDQVLSCLTVFRDRLYIQLSLVLIFLTVVVLDKLCFHVLNPAGWTFVLIVGLFPGILYIPFYRWKRRIDITEARTYLKWLSKLTWDNI